MLSFLYNYRSLMELSNGFVKEAAENIDDLDITNLILNFLKTNLLNKEIVSKKGTSKLVVKNLKILPTKQYDTKYQDNQKLKGRSVANVIKGDIEIQNIKGKVIDSKTDWPIVSVPARSQRGTYIVKGNEWTVIKQLRLKPAPYARERVEDNLFEVFMNIAGGAWRVIFDSATLKMKLRVFTRHYDLYKLLRGLGVTDNELELAWGKEIFDANISEDTEGYTRELATLYKMLRPYATPTDLKQDVLDFMHSKNLNKDVTKLTIGVPADKLDIKVILEASKKVIKLAKREVQPDDTEHLAYKSIWDEGDIIEERLTKALPLITKTISLALDREPTVSYAFSPTLFTNPIMGFFTQSELSRYTEQYNPLSIARMQHQVTIMGEGGIGSENAVSDDSRALHPSHLGVLDPVATPESLSIGLNNHLSIGARKVGKEIAMEVYDRNGEKYTKTLIELADKKIGFYDEFDFSKAKPTPKKKEVMIKYPNGKIELGKPSEVDYIMRQSFTFFDPVTVALPFIGSNSANRVLMGGRHYEQAVALKDPEAPLVQSQIGKDTGYENFVGRNLNPAPVSGIVTKVKDDIITIKDKHGKNHDIFLHKKYPLNATAFYDETPLVEKGQPVVAGDAIAESVYNKGGKSLTLGKNVKVAYMPYYGFNFEDGYVVSESCAKKFTSLHKTDFELELDKKVSYGIDPLLYHFPTVSSKIRRDNFGPDDLPKEGAIFYEGDIVIPAVYKSEPSAEMAVDRVVKRLGYRPTDSSQVWDNKFPGKVVKVIKTTKMIRVLLESEEPAVIGDKISSRGGCKGIIVKIVPDKEMLKDKEGNVVDIVFNPFGLPGRINPGVVFEGWLGKVAAKTGKPYIVPNFTEDKRVAWVKDELTKNNVSDKEVLTDPLTNDTVNVATGNNYFFKLTHLVRKKFSARSAGAGAAYTIEEAPKRESGESGQSLGTLELYSTLAGDARAYLKDTSTLLSQKNDAWWTSYQLGLPTPPLDMPFVLQKFLTYIRGAGINLQQEDNIFKAVPLTDKEILAQSSGEIHNAKVVNEKMQPEAGGLFDERITGGLGGVYWNHIKLQKPVVNPLAEEAVRRVLKLKTTEIDGLLNGTLFYDKNTKELSTNKDGLTGGTAIELMLKDINIPTEISKSMLDITKFKGLDKDNAVKRLKYLKTLKDLNRRPEDIYVLHNVPVLPPKFRPIYTNDDGNVNIADPVHLYREILLVNNQMKDLHNLNFDTKLTPQLEADLYNSVKSLIGLSDPLVQKASYKGILKIIKGAENKFGMYQGRVVNRRRDLSARSTVIVDPKLGIDEVGLPTKMALEIYKPILTKQLVTYAGINPIEARDRIDAELNKNEEKEEYDPKILSALESVISDWPIYMNRSPSLHKYNVLAFKPVLTKGQAIMTNPMINTGLNLDLDGDHLSLCYIRIYVNLSKLMTYISELDEKADKYLWNSLLNLIKTLDINLTDGIIKANIPKEELMPILNKKVMMFKDDIITNLKIEEFPHEEKPFKKENGMKHYRVPDGIKVMSINSEGKYCLSDVTAYTISENLDMHFVNYDHHGLYRASKDKTILVMDTDDYTLKTVPTIEAVGKLQPYLNDISCVINGNIKEIDLSSYVKNAKLTERGTQLKTTSFKLTRDEGYLIGAIIGDGSMSKHAPYMISIANVEKEIITEIERVLNKYFNAVGSCYPNPHTFDGHDCYSEKHQWGCRPLATFLMKEIGTGSDQKRIPTWAFNTDREFRLGILAGLFDTDGALGHDKNNRYGANYTTEHDALAEDVKFLLKTLGVYCSTTSYTKDRNPDKKYYCVNISTYDLNKEVIKDLKLFSPHKVKVQAELKDKTFDEDTATVNRLVPIPISKELVTLFRKKLGAKKHASKVDNCLYVQISKGLKTGYISLSVAKELINRFGEVNSKHYILFKSFVENDRLRWDIITRVDKIKKETMYDLTVPGDNTFMTSDGLFFWDSCIGYCQAIRRINLSKIESTVDVPLVHLYNTGYTYDFLPNIDISKFIDCDTTKDEACIIGDVYIPGINIMTNEADIAPVTVWTRDKECKEVVIKTWYGQEQIVSAAHSLVTYDIAEGRFLQSKPLEARFKCVPVLLGYAGDVPSLFNFKDDAYFTIYTFLFAHMQDDLVQYFSKKSFVIDKIAEILKSSNIVFERTMETVLIKDVEFSALLNRTFYLNGTRRLPKPFWITTKEYRIQAVKALVDYSLFVIKKEDGLYPSIRLPNYDASKEMKKILESIGVNVIVNQIPGGRAVLKLSREIGAYRDELGLRLKIRPVGVLPVTTEEFKELKTRYPHQLGLVEKGEDLNKFVPVWVIDEILERGEYVSPSILKRKPTDYYFDVIISARLTGQVKEMFDLTVPGTATFSLKGGLVVNDTVSIAVPISEEARSEALNNMLPSKHIFSARANYGVELANSIIKEYVLGLHLITKPIKNKAAKKYKNTNDALIALTKREIKINDEIQIGKETTCIGRKVFIAAFPPEMKVEDKTYTKKDINNLIAELFKNHPTKATETLNKIKDLGAHYVTTLGFSFGIDDFMGDYKKRDKIMNDQIAKIPKIGFEKAMTEADKLIMELTKSFTNNSWIQNGIASGVLGSKANQLQQLIMTPVAVTDHKDRVVPVPMTKSYSEGFTLPEYWLTLPGSRKGLMGRALSTQETGAFGKTLLAGVSSLVIMGEDCKTVEGIELPIESTDVLDRFVANGKNKGEMMTPDLQKELIKKGVKTIVMRSPLKCKLTNGLCAKCFGLDEKGQLPKQGFAIGALCGTTAAEPVTQLALNAFHTGGSIATKKSGVDQLNDILRVQKTVKGRSTLSTIEGTVEKVTPSIAGWKVQINGFEHFVPKKLGLKVKEGDSIKPGDQLDINGFVHPRDLLETTKDSNRVEKYIIDQLNSIYNQGGVKLKRKILETIVTPMTKNVQIIDIDPKISIETGFYPGDIISRGQAAVLDKHKDITKIQIEPQLVGIQNLPHVGEDLLAELMADEPHNTLAKAPMLRKGFNIFGHPITAHVFGKSMEIGKQNAQTEKQMADSLISKLVNFMGVDTTLQDKLK